MFRKITEQKEEKKFAAIWEEACVEKGFSNDPYSDRSTKYFILAEPGEEIAGTVAITPYAPEIYTTVEDLYNFSSIEKIKNNKEYVYEIDRLSLKREYRGKGYVEAILETLFFYGIAHDTKYYIAVIERSFLRALKIFYGVEHIEILTDSVQDKKATLTPIILDFEKLKETGLKQDWFKAIDEKVKRDDYPLTKKKEKV